MSTPVRVGFLGNCQAQSLETWVSQIATKIEVIQFDPIWLIRETDLSNYQDRFQRCDVIFAQRLADDYPIEWLRTNVLKSTFSGRVLTWPNVYFDGYFPGLRYLYHGPHGKQVGPLDEYHFDFVIDAYRRKLSVSDCVEFFHTEKIFEFAEEPVHASLQQIFDREIGLDIVMSDFIIQNFGARRSMFSMNHPCDHVLKELMLRLMSRAGLKDTISPTEKFQYTLDKIIVPFHPAISSRYHLYDDLQQSEFKGVRVATSDRQLFVGDSISYNTKELVECFYKCYEFIELA